MIFAPYSDLTIIYFAIYTILSLCFVLLFQIDGKLLLKAIMTFPIIGILDISGIFTTNSYQYETITMGVSYAFMPTIVSSIVYFFAYYKGDNTKDKIINTLILSINMVYLFNVVQFGSRGVVLCFLMCFVFFFCFKYDNEKNRVYTKGAMVLLFAVILIIFIMNMWTIFSFLLDVIEALGFHINAIDKFFRLNTRSRVYLKW